MGNRIVFTLLFFAVLIGHSQVRAHDAFKEPFEQRYDLKSIACTACHPNAKDRSIHNKFGKYYEEALKGKDISAKFKEAEAKGEAAVAEYEKEMVVHFVEAMKAVEKKSISFEELIQAGMLNGTRLNKTKE